MSLIIEKPCDYMMPCGWCELREMMCPNIQPWTITPTWQYTTTTYTAGETDGGEE